MMSNTSAPAVWGLTVRGFAVALTAMTTASLTPASSDQTVKDAATDESKPGRYIESSEPGGEIEFVPFEGATSSNAA